MSRDSKVEAFWCKVQHTLKLCKMTQELRLLCHAQVYASVREQRDISAIMYVLADEAWIEMARLTILTERESRVIIDRRNEVTFYNQSV